ncbi:MAG TPA: class I SAM-dependent methyltransferase [Pyrinomonadaceae bacterium]
MRDIFSDIYERRVWGDGESVSGPGSSVARTSVFRDEVAALLKGIKAERLLDAACGDFNWLKEIRLDSVYYTGVDIVTDIVLRNQQAYGNSTRTFVNLDITRDVLPRADVILCRDTLVHFSVADIVAAIQNFKKSGSSYLLTTTFTSFGENTDIRTGDWRQINLQISPFDFPQPLTSIDEKCDHSGGVFINKRLALWALEDIRL